MSRRVKTVKHQKYPRSMPTRFKITKSPAENRLTSTYQKRLPPICDSLIAKIKLKKSYRFPNLYNRKIPKIDACSNRKHWLTLTPLQKG